MNIKLDRKSNFELLRIFAMFIIIWNHLCNSIYLELNHAIDFNLVISKAFYVWTGNLGNYLFIFVSGYFVSNSRFSWRKVFKLWFQIFTISVVIGIVFYIFKLSIITGNVNSLGFYNADTDLIILKRVFSTKDLFQSLLPTLLGNNWFASAYLLFYMFTPFLNEFLRILDQNSHKKLILLMGIVGTVLYMIPGQGIFESNNLFYFILAYFIANYIKIYDPKILKNQKVNLLLSLVLSIIFILWIILIIWLNDKLSFINREFIRFFSYPFALTRFPILICSIFVFCFFKNLQIKNNKLINLFASSTFGVYLIHENPFLKGVLWHEIFSIDKFIESKYLIFYMLFTVVSTFICCSIIDLFRSHFIEKPILRLINKKKENI
ncbi:MAG: acyltransferase family protein [Spirochaetaceae bacterium]|nr:acyltransferase family protein [Spirochaetaceae bacterium]